METILFFDWYADCAKRQAYQYASFKDDLAVLETQRYLVYLVVHGDLLIKNGAGKVLPELPGSAAEDLAQGRPVQGGYEIVELPSFTYCISRKEGENEEIFMICSAEFDQLKTPQEEKEQMHAFLLRYLTEVEEEEAAL